MIAVPSPELCPQCGQDWSAFKRGGAVEFCPRCGSPVLATQFDPLKTRIYGGALKVNRQAKLIVRFGVWGVGVMCFLTGVLMSYSGWLSADELDVVQLWVSRLGGPVLAVQGALYAWLPFRRASAAPVVSLLEYRERR